MSKATNTFLVLAVAIGLGFAPSVSAQSGPASNRVVNAEDLASAGISNAMEGIRLLHPQMRLGRGIPQLDGKDRSTPMVYLDGLRVAPETLQGIHRSEIVEIRYLDAMNATTRFGTNHQAGAILVKTHPGR